MKIQIADQDNKIIVLADLDNMEKSLIAQTICELDILKKQLLEEYEK